MKHQAHWVKWGFAIFGALLVLINAALTAAFGAAYLGTAFGTGDMTSWLGAAYALLIFDLGYIAWFYTFIRTAESTGQRALSLGLAIFSLLGSLSATLQQLATNATTLVDLTAYHDTVGVVALGAMLLMTTAHIISTAAYILLDPKEQVKQVMAGVKANALSDALTAAGKQLAIDNEIIVETFAADVRADILAIMGFTPELHQITKAKTADAPALASANEVEVIDGLDYYIAGVQEPDRIVALIIEAAEDQGLTEVACNQANMLLTGELDDQWDNWPFKDIPNTAVLAQVEAIEGEARKWAWKFQPVTEIVSTERTAVPEPVTSSNGNGATN